ncbi:MAG TPA: NADH-quinone oxidoreductase subunit L [Chloroflexota bacterium]|nr:NADH-quinone oxidoreductase subunit L [Chloroflexota bacterium]
MQHLIWGVLLFPLAGFVVNTLWQRLRGDAVAWIGPGSVFLAFICALGCFAWLQGQSEATRYADEIGWRWALAGQFRLDFGLQLDTLSSTMSLIVTGVGFLILVYATGYMSGEHSFTAGRDGYRRFFSQMDLFIFTMLLLVLADNYLWLLVGWAGVGLTSYLLIGFYFDRPSAVKAARKAFVMNVIGDWGLMVAIFMMFILFGGVDFRTVFSHAHTLPFNGTVITVMCLLLLVGAVAKSAQLPLYTWLPDAMEGPTPVSALIHAATMVTAGVYLVARSYPIYQQSPIGLHTVAFIGAIGTIFAAGLGLANNDIKRILAYSTMSQIAYMFVGVGVAVYSAGIFHLLEHAFFKALLFMGAGAVMQAMHEELDIQKMGGLKSRLPFTYWTFLIGVLAIIGTPGFSGFFSKEDVIGAAYARASHGDPVLWIVWALAVITAGLTAIYMFRLFFLVFHGQSRDPGLAAHAHDPQPSMRIPMAVLAVLSVVGGWISIPGVYNEMEAWLSSTLHRYPVRGPALVPQPFEPVSLILTLAVTLAGFLVAWQIYYRRSPSPQRVASMAPGLYRFMAHRYYVDELYELLIVRPIKVAASALNRFFELDFVDATVDFAAAAVTWSSRRMRVAQTGYVRNYALAILFGAVLLVGYYFTGLGR